MCITHIDKYRHCTYNVFINKRQGVKMEEETNKILGILRAVTYIGVIIVVLAFLICGIVYCAWGLTVSGLLMIFICAPICAFLWWLNCEIIYVIIENLGTIRVYQSKIATLLAKLKQDVECIDVKEHENLGNSPQNCKDKPLSVSSCTTQHKSVSQIQTVPESTSEKHNEPTETKANNQLYVKLSNTDHGSVPLIKLYNQSIDDNSFDE